MSADFYGLPTRSIGNRFLRLDVLAEAGPRIVRLLLADSNENLLAELPDIHWPTPYGEYSLRGGHRLTIAPEAAGRSYVPDDDGLIIEDVSGGVRVVRQPDNGLLIGKSITIELHAERPAVTLQHCLQNAAAGPIEIAPWAVTQLPLGGIAVMPLRMFKETDRRAPDRHVVLWPYTTPQDQRLFVDDDFVWIDAQPMAAECKLGVLARGWLGYLRSGVFFLKRFDPQLGQPHPDRNCNAEVYCNDRFVELETLGSLCRLEPGQSVMHVETWEIHRFEGVKPTPDSLRDVLQSITG